MKWTETPIESQPLLCQLDSKLNEISLQAMLDEISSCFIS